MRDPALSRAIAEAGGVAALARSLGIKSQAVSQWDKVPAERVVDVVRAARGKVTAHELRPDVFKLPFVESGDGDASVQPAVPSESTGASSGPVTGEAA